MGKARSNSESFEAFLLNKVAKLENQSNQNSNINGSQYFITPPPQDSIKQFLKMGTGGVLGGPLAWNPSVATIDTGAIDIGHGSGKLSGFVIVAAESGTADDLTDINNFVFGYQDLTLLADSGDTITIKNSGNIDITEDLVLSDSQAATFFYNTVDDKWQIKGGIGDGGGGSGTPPFQYGLTLIATTTGNVELDLDPGSGAKGQHFIFSNELTGDVDITFTNPPADGFSQPYIIEYELGTTVYDVTFNGTTDVTPIAGTADATTKLAGYITNNGGVISSTFTMTSTAGTGGGTDASLWANFTAVSDVNFGTFDATALDRLLFEQAAGDALAAGSTGITSNNVGEMQFNVPDAQEYIWSTDAEIRMRLDQSGTNSDTIFTVQTPVADALAIPEILINRIDPTPADDTEFGLLSFQGSNAASSGGAVIDPHKYAQIAVEYENVVDGREAASMIFTTSYDNGAATAFTPFMALNTANSGRVDMIRDVDFAGDAYMNSNEIFLDDDANSGILSTIDDVVQIFTGNTVRFAVANTRIAIGTIFAINDNSMEWQQITEPADIDVVDDEGVVFFDDSTDPGILKIKKKNSGGTVSLVSLEQGGGSGANTALSNLADPTAVSQDINMLGKSLTFDTDKDTFIESSTDDTLNFAVGAGGVKMQLSNAGLLMSSQLNMGSTKLTGLIDPTVNSDAVNLQYFNSNAVTNPMTEALDMGSTNDITNADDIFFAQANTSIETGSNFLTLDYPTSGTFRIREGAQSRIILVGSDVRIATNSANLGFYGANGISKPTVTGSAAGNAALQSLLTQLDSMGLITDSST